MGFPANSCDRSRLSRGSRSNPGRDRGFRDMTRRGKFLVTAAVLAGLAGAAIPALAAQTGGSNGAAVQSAFGGPDDGRGNGDESWHHHPHGFGPGGSGWGGPERDGPGAMGFGPP